MSVALVFKTESRAALDWVVELEAAHEAQRAAIAAFLDELELEHGRRFEAVTYLGAVRGLAGGEDGTVPQGMRVDSYGHYVPRMNTRAGKELAKRIADIPPFYVLDQVGDIGVAQFSLSGNRMHSPGIVFDRDDTEKVTAIYQTWGTLNAIEDILDVAASVKEVEWSQVPLSAWFARVEALEA